MRWTRISVTGWPVRIDSPRSPVRKVSHVDDELDGEGLVEPEALAEYEARLRRRLLLERSLARVARHYAHHQEDDGEHAEKHRDARGAGGE